MKKKTPKKKIGMRKKILRRKNGKKVARLSTFVLFL